MRISDLKLFDDLSQYQSMWEEVQRTIEEKCKDDPLYENYLDLNPRDYLHFAVVVYDKKIVSFGAIEYSPHKWGEDIVRVLTRFWIHPDYRSPGMTKWGPSRIRFSSIILPRQIEFLKLHHPGKIKMITREGDYKNSFRQIVDLANRAVIEKEDLFVMQDGLYNVCGHDHTCAQMIALSGDYEETLAAAQELGYLNKL